MNGRTYVAVTGGSAIAVICDSAAGTADSRRPSKAGWQPGPTVVRDMLFLPYASDIKRDASCVMLDIAGRKVMDLIPGENDVRYLSPGVYFVRRASSIERQALSVHKVVIQR